MNARKTSCAATNPDPSEPVESIPGIGPGRAASLAEAGIATVRDLALWWPKRYVPLPEVQAIADALPGRTCAFRGKVRSRRKALARRRTGGHLHLVLEDETGAIVVHFYNQGYFHDDYAPGTEAYVVGMVDPGPPLAVTPIYHRRGDEAEIGRDQGWLVDYPRVAGLKPGTLARAVGRAVDRTAGSLTDPLPTSLLESRSLVSLGVALRWAHAPGNSAELAAAERRLVYNAFFAEALGVTHSSRVVRDARAIGVAALADADRSALDRAFGFTPTRGQRQAVEAIVARLKGPAPGRVLLQADVGSGKTCVAAHAVLAAVRSGAQAAVLAPTELLARQLHDVLSRRLGELGISVRLLVGNAPAADRRASLRALADGAAHVGVGTQALLESTVEFRDLGLVVVDEQHRFGVLQRLSLVKKGSAPHLLVMSATPIPRTLALTCYGDLDRVEMRERPPGRKPIATAVAVDGPAEPFDWGAVAARARDGRKVFVVFPAIEADDGAIPSLLREGRAVAVRHFKGVPVKAVHGEMEESEKARSVEAFRTGSARVLFATTVIEVGLDVPDADEIVIVGAERFGSAQIHQLRGRVGRGGKDGRCTLVVRAGLDPSIRARLQTLAGVHDGFAVAELDLEARGPGDMMGLRQHGRNLLFRAKDDETLLIQAFEDARVLAGTGVAPGLAEELRRFSRQRTTGSKELIDAG